MNAGTSSGFVGAILDWAALDDPAREAALRRPALQRSEELTATVARIIAQVRADGDSALRALTRRFDGCELARFAVGADEFAAAEAKLDSNIKRAIDEARARIETFHRATAPQALRIETAPGVACERILRPIERVGLYVPAGGAPLPGYKKAWFASREFRQGINAAINRDDIVRLVYRTWAQPAAGPLPPSSLWFNRKLHAQPYDPQQARRWFEQAGFVYGGGQLRDPRGNAVAFSIVTNSSSNTRGKMAALIQQDLQKVGVKVTIAPLEFRSLIQRIGETADYEACLLGIVNVDDDPNGQMNVWLSSSANHPWNPAQKSPATPWEAEIDRLMTRQASSADQRIRKQAFDRVQEMVREEAPIIYLVNPHALVAYDSDLRSLQPAAARPHLFWNIVRLSFGNRGGGNSQGASDARTAAAH